MFNSSKSVLTILVVALGAATMGAARAASRSTRNENRRIPGPPTALPIDPIQNVGRPLNHKVKSFVDAQLAASQFEKEYDFPVDKAGAPGQKCLLTVRAAKHSQYIPRKNDGQANGYVVALIRNQYDCKPKRFSLGKNDRAAWIVRFDSQDEYADRRVVGTAYLVTLGGGADDFLASWSFWQCGSNHKTIPDTASAVIQNETQPADICGTANPDHNAARISRERMAARNARTLLDSGDPAVWFACGTDCCYSELRS
jgi:hypothetical protein